MQKRLKKGDTVATPYGTGRIVEFVATGANVRDEYAIIRTGPGRLGTLMYSVPDVQALLAKTAGEVMEPVK
jgi:hypothetical protein